mgnify:CR=1 FL=1
MMLGIALVLSSCKKDNDNTPAWQKIWILDVANMAGKVEMIGVLDMQEDGKLGYGELLTKSLIDEFKENLDEDPQEIKDIILQFKENDILIVYGSYVISETDETSGTITMSIPIDGKLEVAAGTYRDLTESSMTVIIGGEELKFKTPQALGIKVGKAHDGTKFMGN